MHNFLGGKRSTYIFWDLGGSKLQFCQNSEKLEAGSVRWTIFDSDKTEKNVFGG